MKFVLITDAKTGKKVLCRNVEEADRITDMFRNNTFAKEEVELYHTQRVLKETNLLLLFGEEE